MATFALVPSWVGDRQPYQRYSFDIRLPGRLKAKDAASVARQRPGFVSHSWWQGNLEPVTSSLRACFLICKISIQVNWVQPKR